jgi:hypothetical protein
VNPHYKGLLTRSALADHPLPALRGEGLGSGSLWFNFKFQSVNVLPDGLVIHLWILSGSVQSWRATNDQRQFSDLITSRIAAKYWASPQQSLSIAHTINPKRTANGF